MILEGAFAYEKNQAAINVADVPVGARVLYLAGSVDEAGDMTSGTALYLLDGQAFELYREVGMAEAETKRIGKDYVKAMLEAALELLMEGL